MRNHQFPKYISQVIRSSVVGFVLLLGSIPATVSAADPTLSWEARYNGPENVDDFANAIATDSAGNAYVTGSTYKIVIVSGVSITIQEYATLKYDSNGNQLWKAHYNGPRQVDNGNATAIAVDAAGNVYVTGVSTDIGTGEDYATLKYDSNGHQLWVARYNGPGNSFDSAAALAVDTQGNVYVTGSSYGSATYNDYATVKYDTNGNQLWVARYNGPDGYHDNARALVLDTAGNVYVTGDSGANTGADYATVKYNASGRELWVARYNGTGNLDDTPLALAVDAAGNAYITGASRGTGGYGSLGYYNSDYATIKYGPTGSQLWATRYDGPVNANDAAFALAVDVAGNTNVTGYSTVSGAYATVAGTDEDYATIKYDPNGNQLWIANYNGSGGGNDKAQALKLDADGNVYVTGNAGGSGTFNDYATLKYDTNGNRLWVGIYNGLANGNDVPTALALGAAGNVYVAGYSYGGDITRYDFATIKYSHAVANQPPVANAGPDQTIRSGSRTTAVTLDGSASRDPDGDALTYTWTGPFGTVNGIKPIVKLPPGVYAINLTVSDGKASATDTVVVTITKTRK